MDAVHCLNCVRNANFEEDVFPGCFLAKSTGFLSMTIGQDTEHDECKLPRSTVPNSCVQCMPNFVYSNKNFIFNSTKNHNCA